jgi:hypothetical protein
VLSLAKVITGNPIGFMEGLFGPNISAGGYIEMVHTSGDSGGTSLLGGGGLQFSVFPSSAVGVTGRNLLISGERTSEAEWEYGITHVFNRDIRGHLTLREGDVEVGADLVLMQDFRISTGTDGSSWSMGAGLETGRFILDYGLDIDRDGVAHTLSVTYSPVEGW